MQSYDGVKIGSLWAKYHELKALKLDEDEIFTIMENECSGDACFFN